MVLSVREGNIPDPEYFDKVTIAFTAVDNFAAIVAASTPLEVVEFLNNMFTLLDDIIMDHDVYKVETIADSYMVFIYAL